MDFSSLPPEIQVDYLLRLPPKDVLAYCRTSRSAQAICESSYFWDQKAIQDFGAPFSAICEMNPYWKYWFMREMRYNPGLIGPLVRAGRQDLANKLLQRTGDEGDVLDIAINSDDIATLRSLESYILKFKAPEDTYYREDAFFYLLRDAFESGSDQAAKYLLSLYPDYLHDAIVLNDILETLVNTNNQRGIALLAPYIEWLRRNTPEIVRDLPVLRAYLEA